MRRLAVFFGVHTFLDFRLDELRACARAENVNLRILGGPARRPLSGDDESEGEGASLPSLDGVHPIFSTDDFRSHVTFVEVDSEDGARRVTERCLTVDSTHQILVQESTLEDAFRKLYDMQKSGQLGALLADVEAESSSLAASGKSEPDSVPSAVGAAAPPAATAASPAPSVPTSPFRLSAWGRNRRVRKPEYRTLLQRLVVPFAAPPPAGLGLKVDLSHPTHHICMIIHFERNDIKGRVKKLPEELEVRLVLITRQVSLGGRKGGIMKKYDLKLRQYIGTTSMPAVPSFLVANMALARPGSLIMDPFVGTGSLAVACSHFGSFLIGSDIDPRCLRGERGKGALRKHGRKQGKRKAFGTPGVDVYSNYEQYGLRYGVDFFRADIAQLSRLGAFHRSEVLDAVVCDPPYGVRESCRRIGRKVPIDVANLRPDHIPSRVQYSQEAMMTDLVNFAARALVIGGRFVFWLVEEPGVRVMPSHPSLRLVCEAVEILRPKMHRRLVTMEKVMSFEASGGWCEDSGKKMSSIRTSLFPWES